MSNKIRNSLSHVKLGGVDYGLINKYIADARTTLKIMDEDHLFDITWDGHTFNGLPFLLVGTDWWPPEGQYRISGIATELTQSRDYVDLELIIPKGCDKHVLNVLLPSTSWRRVSDVAQLVCSERIRDFAYLVSQSASSLLQYLVIENRREYLTYQCPGVCNTQAFSYYLLLPWLFTISPKLGTYLRRQLKICGFDSIMDMFCPEGSALRRYVHGEISGLELEKEYTKPQFPDGSSLQDREMLSMMSDGAYTGVDFRDHDRAVVESVRDMLYGNKNKQFGMQLGRYYAHSRNRWDSDVKIRKLESSIHRLEGELERQRQKTFSVQSKKDALSGRIRDKDAEIAHLKSELAGIRSKEEISKQEKELKSELGVVQKELATILDKYVKVKAELRSLKKQLRPSAEEELAVTVEEVEKPKEEIDIISALRHFRILVVGGAHLGIVDELEAKGIKALQFHSSLKGGFRCDVILVVTRFVAHKDVAAAVSWVNGDNYDLVYFDGTNKEKCFKTLYDSLLG